MDWGAFTVAVEGALLSGERRGRTDAAPLVLVHGMGGQRHDWDRLVAALPADWPLIRYDLRGFGASDADEALPYSHTDDLLALLFSHPQVYVEVSMLANVEPRAGFHRYLQAIVDAGYGDRVMFGSDQMVWPGLVTAAVEGIESAPFLSPSQKRAIFYDNAARFLRLSPEEIARHHGR